MTAADPAVPIHRLSFPLASVVALLVAVASGVWWIAVTLGAIREDLSAKAGVERVEALEGRVRTIEDWRIEHQIMHPSFPPMTDEDRD